MYPTAQSNHEPALKLGQNAEGVNISAGGQLAEQ
jgi:hypothetical protein